MKKQFTLFKAVIAFGCALTFNNAQAQWVRVGSPGPGFNVYDMQALGGKLYAAGASGNGAKGISHWDGTSWTSIARVRPQFGQFVLGVNMISVYNSQIVAGGSCDSIGGIKTTGSDVVTYDGNTWSKLGANPPSITQVNCFAVYNNELYVGGQGINKWNGTTWTSVVSGTGIIGQVSTMAVYNNDLYIGGNFKKIGGQNMTTGVGFAKWDGTNITVLPGMFDTIPAVGPYNVANLISLLPFQGNLVAVGDMNTAATTRVHGAAKWNGTSWSDMNGGIKGNGVLQSSCLAADANNLYIVGAIQRVNTTSTNDSINQAARWDGTSWHPMLGTPTGYAFLTAEIFNAEIYSGYQEVVKWMGTTSVGMNETKKADGIIVYPNPVKDIFYIKGLEERVEIKVFNSNGQLLQTANIKAGEEIKINCELFPQGFYFVKISGEGFSKNGRFIKIE